jgi:transglutaminase-like putative cysteine protease
MFGTNRPEKEIIRMCSMKLQLFFLCFSLCYHTSAQYAVSEIPDELKDGAQMVIRDYHYEFEVQSQSMAIVKVKRAYTVFSEEGNDEAGLYINYDEDREVTEISALFYSASGVQFDKFKRSDFKDVKYGDGFSLYDDNRILYMRPSSTTYPYTVVYEYTIESEKLLFYPTWGPINDEKVSLQYGRFTVKVPKGHDFRYKAWNIEYAEPKKSLSSDHDTYVWEVRNVHPIEYEPFSNGYAIHFPVIYTAPNKFLYDGYEGNFKTWDDYSIWYNEINKDRDSLTEENRNKVRHLTNGIESDLEKTRKIYEYLQENTRYVSIQLGIGGYQSFPANETADNGYGDCKALSTFTKGMLSAAGIDSYYVLVRAGRNATPIQSDFPSQQFNHVFLCVPIQEDTVWLECTSQTNPFGYLGTFTGNREVLVVNEEGGKIVRTPKYDEKVNLQHRKATVLLGEDGNAKADIRTTYQGIQYENDNIDRYVYRSSDDQKKWLYKKIDIKSFEIEKFNFEVQKTKVPSIDEELELSMRSFASISGKRLFLRPNLMNKYSYIPPEDESRKSSITFQNGWTDVDSIRYIIPEGYYMESQLIESSVESDFGSYEIRVIQDKPNEILYIRKMVKNSGVFPPEKYHELRQFLKKIVRSDKKKVVFAKKT